MRLVCVSKLGCPLSLKLGWEPPVSMVAVMPGWGLSVGLC